MQPRGITLLTVTVFALDQAFFSEGFVTCINGMNINREGIVQCNVIVNESVCLICSIYRNTPNIGWFFGYPPSRLVRDSLNLDSTHAGGLEVNECHSANYSLKLLTPTLSHNGEAYFCKHQNEVITKFTLRVLAKPTLSIVSDGIFKSSLLITEEGSTGTLNCIANGVTTPITLVWKINDAEIKRQTFINENDNQLQQNLSLTFVPSIDVKNITCACKGPSIKTVSSSLKVIISKQVPPKVFLSFGNVTLTNASYQKDHGYQTYYRENKTYVAENKTINVTCLAEGAKPEANITWMINGIIVDDVPAQVTQRNLQENRTFDSISALQFSPTGGDVNVTCNVSLDGTETEASASATFLTYILPRVFFLLNDGRINSDVVYVEQTETVNITCYAEGSRPHAILSWEEKYDYLESSLQERVNAKNATFDTLLTLIISPGSDIMRITCRSSVLEINDIRTFDLKIETYVLGEPSITFNGKSLTVISVDRNDNVTLICSAADSRPIPTLTWYINGQLPQEGTSEISSSAGSSNLIFQPKEKDIAECVSYLTGPNITRVAIVGFHFNDQSVFNYISNVIVPCAAVIVTVLLVICIYSAAKRLKGTQSTTISGTLDIPMEETSNITQAKNIQKEYVVGANTSLSKPPDLKLPEIPDSPEMAYYSELPEQENAYELNFHTEYYSAMGKSGAKGKMFSEKDICFILNMKMGHIYDRWMGTIDANLTEKCVILSTVSAKLRKKEIHWHKFVKQALEIPLTTNLSSVEGIGIYEGKLYLVHEHMACETLDVHISVPVSRTEVIGHLIGILEGLEVIQSFGLLHPGLSTKKVLLTKKGICKLYDFCLAEDASNTVRIRKSWITCTLNQLAPEALLRDKYSKASDVWSVAVVIWEILSCGTPPFPNEEQSTDSEKAVYSIPETWPTNYKLLRNEQLLKSWNQETSLRPTLYQLKSSLAESFEALDTYGLSNTSTDDLAAPYVHMKGMEKTTDDS